MSSSVGAKNDQVTETEFKMYKIRWLILGLFVAYSASNAIPWLQFCIIADVVVRYYGVSLKWVDWTSIIYMAIYIPFIFPASYILQKLGLRKTVIIGMVGTCAGSWIQVGAVRPDRFWIAFLGQTVIGFSQVFVLSVPSRLAAVWFGPSQVSFACSIGVLGNEIGTAIGCILPPKIVKYTSSHEDNAFQFYILFLSTAALTTLLLILILIFFQNAPPTPPSYAVIEQESAIDIQFNRSLKNFVTNRNFMLLLLTYGINFGIFYAISTLLNQIILHHYPTAHEDAGQMGLLFVISGLVGSSVCGRILDRFRKFKETTLLVYACSALAMVAYVFSLSKEIHVVYAASAVLGFFVTALLPAGHELAVELTYPESEGTSSGLLNVSCQLFGIIFTFVYSEIFDRAGNLWANIVICIILFIGTAVTACIKSDLRRQSVNTSRGSG